MARLIERFLNDAVLGFLALLSLFLMIVPSVFALPAAGSRAVVLAEYAIVALFALEYLAGMALAPDRRRYVLNRWRILDLLIILAATLALLPAVPEVLRSSPVLRLLRLGRFALLGARSGLALSAAREPLAALDMPAGADLAVLALTADGETFESIAWDAALRRIGTAEPDWLFVSGVAEEHLAPIATALGVPERAVRGLFQSSVPRFDRLERFTTLFVRYPLPMQDDGRLRRTPLLIVGSADNVVVLSRDRTDLEQRVGARLASVAGDAPRMAKATVALLGEVVSAYTDVVEGLETTLLGIESAQVTLNDEAFLARSFDLRADILRARSALKHLRSVMRDLQQGQAGITLGDSDRSGPLRLLAEDVDDLYQGIEDLRESLQALVDLRLNVASFQMNRVMRLLALLTALALIPATAGGLLGMNLLDTPWPATLAQISFGVAAGMALSLYVFAIKGWLR